ncbi:MAG: hypothetical protein HY868_04305 [Chloroflexi bacterium]|nr:hypothetical protein [Chloroflexota bacterium]
MSEKSDDLIWQVRAFVYEHFAATTRPPTIDEAATRFGLTPEHAATIYVELGQRHAIFLDPGTHNIRMANPFSAIPTSFQVHANGKTYWANCAWDSLGIPAALHTDATIEAMCAENQQPIALRVQNGQVVSGDERVHFLVPFRRWYDDLIRT